MTGLCGTGSGVMSVDRIEIPLERTVSLIKDPPVADSAIYRFPAFGLPALGIAAVAIGNASKALEEFEAMATRKIPQGARRALIERPAVKEELQQAYRKL